MVDSLNDINFRAFKEISIILIIGITAMLIIAYG